MLCAVPESMPFPPCCVLVGWLGRILPQFLVDAFAYLTAETLGERYERPHSRELGLHPTNHGIFTYLLLLQSKTVHPVCGRKEEKWCVCVWLSVKQSPKSVITTWRCETVSVVRTKWRETWLSFHSQNHSWKALVLNYKKKQIQAMGKLSRNAVAFTPMAFSISYHRRAQPQCIQVTR